MIEHISGCQQLKEMEKSDVTIMQEQEGDLCGSVSCMSLFVFAFAVLGIKPRLSYMLAKCPPAELPSPSPLALYLDCGGSYMNPHADKYRTEPHTTLCTSIDVWIWFSALVI